MCNNPWKKCQNDDVAVVIKIGSNELNICRKCWDEIGNSNRQWTSAEEEKICKRKIQSGGYVLLSSGVLEKADLKVGDQVVVLAPKSMSGIVVVSKADVAD